MVMSKSKMKWNACNDWCQTRIEGQVGSPSFSGTAGSSSNCIVSSAVCRFAINLWSEHTRSTFPYPRLYCAQSSMCGGTSWMRVTAESTLGISCCVTSWRLRTIPTVIREELTTVLLSAHKFEEIVILQWLVKVFTSLERLRIFPHYENKYLRGLLNFYAIEVWCDYKVGKIDTVYIIWMYILHIYLYSFPLSQQFLSQDFGWLQQFSLLWATSFHGTSSCVCGTAVLFVDWNFIVFCIQSSHDTAFV